MKFLLLSLLMLGLGTAASAQSAVNGSGFLIRVWQSEEGLPGNVVRSIGQTDDGFLWVATAEGLARFDGIEFEPLITGGPYRGRRFGFHRVFTPRDRGVWVSTFLGGLYRVRGNELVGVIEDTSERNPPVITRLFSHYGHIYFLRDGELWHLTNDGPVRLPDPPVGVRRAMSADARNEAERGRSDDVQSPNLLVSTEGDRWSIRNRSLYFEDANADEAVPVIPELQGRMVANDLLEDREGNLWVGSPVQGLIRIRKSRVTPLQTRDGPYLAGVQAAIRDREGTWWIGNRSGGVDRIRDGVIDRLELVEGGYPRPLSCIFEDSSGKIWFASRDGSLFAWNGENFDIPFSGVAGVSQVNAIAEDSDGWLWFAGGRGICRWDGESIDRFDDQPELDALEFSAIALGGQGLVVAATTDGRIFSSDGSALTELETHPALEQRWISSILVLENDELWVTTVGAGLFVRRDGAWHRFSSFDGMPDERLTGLALEDQDSLWIGSLGGILRVSRSELLRRMTNRAIIPRWVRFDRSDGMPTRECVGGAQPGIFVGRDDSLWFPTSGGLAGVRPAEVRINNAPPALHIHPVEIDGRPFPANGDELVVGPGRVQIDFRFTGLSLSAPEKVTYRVRLQPFDDRPKYIGTQRTASYQAVPPGRYTFEVIAMNGDGVANILPASVTVVVEPHFWETPLFLGLATTAVLLITLSTGWIVARRRMKRSLEQFRVQGLVEGERSRISRDLHDDLGASLTELSILSALGAEEKDESQLRPTMETLSFKAKQVVGTLDEIVWAATPREDTLRSLIDYLAAFCREFLSSVNVPLDLDATRDIPDVPIGPRRRHNVFLTTREAINNAVKHADASSIAVRIAIEAGHLRVTVTDDGKGFDLEYAENTGNGLSNLRQRMEDCGGSCTIDSIPGEGTVIDIRLPLPETPAS